MKEPHRIGNDGEAPMDVEPGWADRLRKCVERLELSVCAEGRGADVWEYADVQDVSDVTTDLKSLAEEIEAYNKRWGAAF